MCDISICDMHWLGDVVDVGLVITVVGLILFAIYLARKLEFYD